ncbi:MAG: 2,5-diamino-6-(ribosylamino)-4(3H)-pyrimidinone 5'-phosphate reductase [Methanosarcinales archaeon]|nr:2,5-diamino-6-(ribosylamino)-4(3H)-pyrimidinone 5'-phosphate reductase [Methanosarcinales archaeon]
MSKKRPFIFINSAMSADGKISSRERRQVRISGRDDLARVDALRAESDAVMVGVGTVLADDPRLRIKSEKLRRERSEGGRPEDPLRVVADSRARTPPQAQVLGEGCILAVSEAAPAQRREELSRRCQVLCLGRERVDLPGLMEALWERGVHRMMVEGGATLNWSLLESGLVDEIYVYLGPLIIGGEGAPTLVDGPGFVRDYPPLELISARRMDEGLLLAWRVLSP